MQEQGSGHTTLKERQVYYVQSMVPHLLVDNPTVDKPAVVIVFEIGMQGEPNPALP